jgi:hypothetical protein
MKVSTHLQEIPLEIGLMCRGDGKPRVIYHLIEELRDSLCQPALRICSSIARSLKEKAPGMEDDRFTHLIPGLQPWMAASVIAL